MDIRIGAKSLIYGSRNASKVTDRALKASFDMMMAREKKSVSQSPAAKIEKVDSINQGTAAINGNDLAQRLENVHKKIEEMDFTEKYSYETYKSIHDAYEAEFGFLDMLCYLDKDTFDIIYKDREDMFASEIPSYQSTDIRLFRYAMGYDEMSKEEIIASIKERVGGNSYVHKICELNELGRAGIITPSQGSEIFRSLVRQAEMDYCAKMGFDYLTWSTYPEKYYMLPAGCKWDPYFLACAAETETTWLEIIEGIKDFPAMWDWERDALLKELGDTKELLIESGKA